MSRQQPEHPKTSPAKSFSTMDVIFHLSLSGFCGANITVSGTTEEEMCSLSRRLSYRTVTVLNEHGLKAFNQVCEYFYAVKCWDFSLTES